jgi:hypothetical protein
MSGYHEFRHYSPVTDSEMVRLSVFDKRGAEYFMLLPYSGAKRYRYRKQAALEAIDYAIEAKLEPGQVVMPENEWERSVSAIIADDVAKKRAEAARYGRELDE